MKREYARYGLTRFRNVVGGLQLLGATGLLVGLQHPWAGLAGSGGLALLMLLGVGVRIKIKDSLLQTSPALAYMALNAYLCGAAFYPPLTAPAM